MQGAFALDTDPPPLPVSRSSVLPQNPNMFVNPAPAESDTELFPESKTTAAEAGILDAARRAIAAHVVFHLAPFPVTADRGIGFILPLARMCWKPFGVSIEARVFGGRKPSSFPRRAGRRCEATPMLF